MKRRTHTILGLAVGLGVETVRPLTLPLPTAPFPVGPIVGHVDLIVGGLALVALGALVARLPDIDLRLGLPHRGATHSLACGAAVILAAAMATVAWVPAAATEVAAVTAVAFASHICADLTNPTPMALLWPLPGRQRPSWLPAAAENSWRGKGLEAIVTVAIVGIVGWRVCEVVPR